MKADMNQCIRSNTCLGNTTTKKKKAYTSYNQSKEMQSATADIMTKRKNNICDNLPA